LAKYHVGDRVNVDGHEFAIVGVSPSENVYKICEVEVGKEPDNAEVLREKLPTVYHATGDGWDNVVRYVLDNYVPKKIAEEKIEKLAQRYSGHPDSIWNSPGTNRAFWRDTVLSMLHYDTP